MAEQESSMREPDSDGQGKSRVVLLIVRCNLYFEGISSLLSAGENAAILYSVYDKHTLGILKPDVIVMDEKATDPQIIRRYPDAKIVLLSNTLETDELMTLASTCKIHGIISPHADVVNFRKALEKVCRGETWLDSDLARQVLNDSALHLDNSCLACASKREREVIRYVCAGYCNKDVAAMIGVTERTVKAHLNNIFKKFNISSRLELAILALKKNSE